MNDLTDYVLSELIILVVCKMSVNSRKCKKKKCPEPKVTFQNVLFSQDVVLSDQKPKTQR